MMLIGQILYANMQMKMTTTVIKYMERPTETLRGYVLRLCRRRYETCWFVHAEIQNRFKKSKKLQTCSLRMVLAVKRVYMLVALFLKVKYNTGSVE